MKRVHDFHNFWRWWSVRFGVLALAFGATATTYAALPSSWLPAIPEWVKTALAIGALLSTFLSVFLRGVDQPNLPPPMREKAEDE